MNLIKTQEMLIATVSGFKQNIKESDPKDIINLAKNYLDILKRTEINAIRYLHTLQKKEYDLGTEHYQLQQELDVINSRYHSTPLGTKEQEYFTARIENIKKNNQKQLKIKEDIEKLAGYKDITSFVYAHYNYFNGIIQELLELYSEHIAEGRVDLATKTLHAIFYLENIINELKFEE